MIILLYHSIIHVIQNGDCKKDMHSSGYISQEDGSGRLRPHVTCSTPKKAPSSNFEESSTASSSVRIATKNGCVIDVRNSDKSSDLTVRDLTMTRNYHVSPRVNIV